MRVRIVFLLKNKGAVLPFHHQALIRSMAEMVMGPAYPLDRYQFNFSGLKGQTKVGREGLAYYSRRVTIVFSALQRSFIDDFCQALFRHRSLYLGSLMLEPEQVEEEVVESIPGSEVKYLCISPLVLSESAAPHESKAFVSPESGTFSDLLYDSTMTRMEESGLYTPDQIASFYKFQVMPDLLYLEKLAAQKKKFARIYSLASASGMREVRGYTFPFTLYAAPEVHRFLFSNGFGAYTQHGFGMLDYSQPVPVSRQLLLGETSKA